MDPVTHAVIGLAVSSFSGTPVGLMNPISVGCALGAMSPDLDAVMKLKDNYTYLKYHRGGSHSVLALAGFSALITVGLSFVYPDFNWLLVYAWTLMGAFSHTLFDILNIYGAKLFAPFYNKKQKLGVLMLYDPIVTILSFILILKTEKTTLIYITVVGIFIAYVIARYKMKQRANRLVAERFGKIYYKKILPALIAPYKWDFVVTTEEQHFVGWINIVTKEIKTHKVFNKAEPKIVEKFENTTVGEYFKSFTPIYHVDVIESEESYILKSTDLRFYFKENFMHHATIVFDKEWNMTESFMHPYKFNKPVFVE